MEHMMIDLETMGTGNRAAIISIGAVKFNNTEITDTFHVGVDLASNKLLNMQIDAGTVMWWLSEDRAEARKAWLALDKVDLIDALQGFASWFGEDSLPTWGNGATFDNVILRNAYEAATIPCPWQFWHDRCFRTIKSDEPVVTPPRRKGVHHSALDDAIHQAEWLIKIWGSR